MCVKYKCKQVNFLFSVNLKISFFYSGVCGSSVITPYTTSVSSSVFETGYYYYLLLSYETLQQRSSGTKITLRVN